MTHRESTRLTVTRLTMLTAILATTLATAAGSSEQASVGIRRVAWLQGCWESVSGDRVVEEQWMAPRGDSMIGMSRTVRGGSLAEFEFLVLRVQGNQLAYEARPSGQPPAAFLSQTISDSMVVFENREHDFPQRIGYKRERPDALLAWIEGTREGQTRRVDFRYRQVACPPSQ